LATIRIVNIIASKKKGKNFVPEEECQLCCSFLKDMIIGMVRNATWFGRGVANITTKIA
jgi:hypothetical protein